MHKYYPPIFVCHYQPNKTRYLYLDSHLHDYPGGVLYIKAQDASNLKSFQAHLNSINSYEAYLSRVKMANDQLYVHLAHQHALLHNNGVILPSYYRDAKATISQLSKSAYAHSIAPHQPRNISPSVLSLALKHRYAFSCMLHDSIPWAIIAEDDIIFRQNTVESIRELFLYMSNLQISPSTPVFIDLAGGCNLKPYCSHPGNANDISLNLNWMKTPVTRTTCAYMLNLSFAHQFLNAYRKPCTAIDSELTDYMLKNTASPHRVNCYWIKSTLFLHGSEIGQYESTILH